MTWSFGRDVVPYPYSPDQVIGGDCVSNIERRFLERLQAKNPYPSLEDYRLARIQAEDKFEVKVKIIRTMAPLDPDGDWIRRYTGGSVPQKIAYRYGVLRKTRFSFG